MLKQRTDLALEKHELNCENRFDDGIIVEEESISNIKISRIIIEDKDASDKANLRKGKYITVEVGAIWNEDNVYLNNCIEIVKNELLGMIDKTLKKCLIVGLGNRRILCDSIGPMVVDNILVTRHIKALNNEMFDELSFLEVSAIATGVLGDTGIETLEITRAVASKIEPDFIIVIDALASRNIERLAKTIQITNSGISPGSGVNNNRNELSMETIGVPVLSVGVPTVVDASTLVLNALEGVGINKIDLIEKYFSEKRNFFVSLKDTDIIIKKMTKLLSSSINYALQNRMEIEDIENLTN